MPCDADTIENIFEDHCYLINNPIPSQFLIEIVIYITGFVKKKEILSNMKVVARS